MRSSIILVGPMGAGKSSVGRRLAESLGLAFVDMDVRLSLLTGLSIPDLFTYHGEVAFRDKEEALLHSLLVSEAAQVISTGGGAILRSASRLNMRRYGHVLYLHAGIPILIERLQRTDVRQRPVLGHREGLKERIATLYKVRDPLYREVAHQIVETEDFTPKQLVQRLVQNPVIKKFVKRQEYLQAY
ncbi:MAG: shikimate kinase [Pseudomonadota bacterium]